MDCDVAHEQIDSTDDQSLRDWAMRLCVDEDRLFAAVQAVGGDIEAVAAYLADLSAWEAAWDEVRPLETRGEWDIFIR